MGMTQQGHEFVLSRNLTGQQVALMTPLTLRHTGINPKAKDREHERGIGHKRRTARRNNAHR
jgi:hypothetical protein